MKICVFGAASARVEDKYVKVVEELGKKLAFRGHSLVFGCGGTGLMGAIARGVKSGGGKIHGVIPEFFISDGVELIYNDCDEVSHTKTMAERKRIMEDEADAFIILPGGVGTIEEFFEVYSLLQVGKHRRPIAVYNIDGYYDKLKEFLIECSEKKFLTRRCVDICAYLNDPDKILDFLENFDSSKVFWRDLLYGY